MAELKDPEKDGSSKPPSSTQPFQRLNTTMEEVVKDIHNSGSSPSSTEHSNSSQESINTNPLSPLERALTVDLETDAEHQAHPALSYTKTGASLATTGSRLPDFEVDFAPDDPGNPRNWPMWYRGMVIGAVSYSTWTVVLYSTSYTSSMPGMMEEFNITSEPVATLGVTTYLLGLAVGSLILAPLSEMYGRRIVYACSLAAYCILVLPCALATSLSEVLVVRFFGYVSLQTERVDQKLTLFRAVAGSAMIANAPGSVSDIVEEKYRALAFSIWSIGPMNGPVTVRNGKAQNFVSLIVPDNLWTCLVLSRNFLIRQLLIRCVSTGPAHWRLRSPVSWLEMD